MFKHPLRAALAVTAVILLGCRVVTGAPVTSAPTFAPATPVEAPTVVDAPTQLPLPTATLAAATQPAPGATVIPIPVEPTNPRGQAPEAIAIVQPGPGSRVVSPLVITGMADPTFEQSLAITILDEFGAPLATGAAQIAADVGQRGPYRAEVPFTVSQEQQGFVQVYAISAKDGGVTHLASVGVLLAPGGAPNIQLAAEQPERIGILQPLPGETIRGGVVSVLGFGLAGFEQTLVVDLLDEEGRVITTVPVMVEAPDLGQPGPFRAELRYSVAATVSGRVQVRDISPANGSLAHLASVEVRLEP